MDDLQESTNGHGARFFDERFVHPKATAIDAPKHIEFDWELLRRVLGEAKDEMDPADYKLLAQVMGELLRWVVKGDKLEIIGRRAVALAWVVNPDTFGGLSATSLAKKIGCGKDMLHEATSEASSKFNIRNRAQGHGWNFKPAKAGRRRTR